MKAQITKVNNYWRLSYYIPDRNSGLVSKHIFFPFPDGAFSCWLAIEKQLIREQKAWAKLRQIQPRYLTALEYTFFNKIWSTSAVGITKRQYGYLSGILERQNGK